MLPLKILTQPDDETCGPTSLHAVYNYYGDEITLEEVISEVSYLESGGTLAVMLAIHALKRGYRATIFTYNLHVFDPTWFYDTNVDIPEKLREQLQYKHEKKLHLATGAYLEFLNLGGHICFEDLSANLLKRHFSKGIPILTGLSATYLYQCAREYVTPLNEVFYNDVKGHPSGHFVILAGYDDAKKYVVVADPYAENLVSGDNYYSVKVGRLINSIMLGILTYDANLLVIQPGKSETC
ncbi:MAG: C39 family peptidase [Gammaproteobacteria bacterium]|nr:C39 family peptidase [Gammaproteobacteria bacterium]